MSTNQNIVQQEKAKLLATMPKLSFGEIRKAIDEAKVALNDARIAERDELLVQILKIVNDNQVPFDQIIKTLQDNDAVYSDNGRVEKIYLDQSNKNNKPWIGQGRRPKWIQEATKQGIDIEKFAVYVNKDTKHVITWYVNPHRKSQRWNGVGAQPMWYKELIEQGYSPEDMECIL